MQVTDKVFKVFNQKKSYQIVICYQCLHLLEDKTFIGVF